MAALVLTACYHQVVDTGLPAGSTKIDKPWTATWIFGLVPATPIDVRTQCPNGVAIVDTQMTFVNGLVGALTLGIYTPLSVSVTCSGSGAALGPSAPAVHVDASSPDGYAAAMENAVKLSRDTGHPVALVWSAADAPTTR
jgi:hypothetical protein